MKEFLVSMSSFLGVLIPQLIYHGYQYLILEKCDSKFGCLGAFQFLAIVFAMLAAIISIGVLISYLILNRNIEIRLTNKLLALYFFIGCVFSYIIFKIIALEISLIVGEILLLTFGFLMHIFLKFFLLKYKKVNQFNS